MSSINPHQTPIKVALNIIGKFDLRYNENPSIPVKKVCVCLHNTMPYIDTITSRVLVYGEFDSPCIEGI